MRPMSKCTVGLESNRGDASMKAEEEGRPGFFRSAVFRCRDSS